MLLMWGITAPAWLQGSQAIICRKKPMCSLSIIPALLIKSLGIWVRLVLDGISPLSCLPILPSLAGLQTPTMHALETVAVKRTIQVDRMCASLVQSDGTSGCRMPACPSRVSPQLLPGLSCAPHSQSTFLWSCALAPSNTTSSSMCRGLPSPSMSSNDTQASAGICALPVKWMATAALVVTRQKAALGLGWHRGHLTVHKLRRLTHALSCHT